ncbi:hypothetical protein AAAC51_43425 [Priestia megaterium]
MAKQGTAANIAISMLGKDASMKDLNDRIMLINQGLMRMNQVALGLGIALAGFTATMFNAAKGQMSSQCLKREESSYWNIINKLKNELKRLLTRGDFLKKQKLKNKA